MARKVRAGIIIGEVVDVGLNDGWQAVIQVPAQYLFSLKWIFVLMPGKGDAHPVEELGLDVCRAYVDHPAGLHAIVTQVPDTEPCAYAEAHGLAEADAVEIDHVADRSAGAMSTRVMPDRDEDMIHDLMIVHVQS